jgi:hypothetical protein
MRPPSHNLLFVILFVVQSALLAQDVTTVSASDEDISDNLDLEAEHIALLPSKHHRDPVLEEQDINN